MKLNRIVVKESTPKNYIFSAYLNSVTLIDEFKMKHHFSIYETLGSLDTRKGSHCITFTAPTVTSSTRGVDLKNQNL